MHALVVRVRIEDRESAERMLRDRVVPGASQAPGFVAGYWTWKDDTGLSMVVFESEAAAAQMGQQISRLVDGGSVTVESVEVREVVAHA